VQRCAKTITVQTKAKGVSVARQKTEQKQLDTFVTRQMKKDHVPGVALGVLKNGRFVYCKGYGYANLEHHVPVTPETIFQSGSVGKQFTAAAILLLVQEGKLSLEDTITKFFKTPQTWKAVTICHLLTHTAGTSDFPKTFDYRNDYTEDELLDLIVKTPLTFKPGEKWNYSNHGYILLGILVRKITGKFYGDFLRERVFDPLGMKKARVISEADIIPHRAAGYEVVKGKVKNQTWVSPSLCTTADGSLYLSLLDYAKWDAALCGEKFLKRQTLEQMWTPAVLNNGSSAPAANNSKWGYGFGWFVARKGPRLVWHDGSWQGFRTTIFRYLDEQLTVVVLANGANADPNKLAKYAAKVFR
jgi:D-alanyl-D-alanine carboxypeptidase